MKRKELHFAKENLIKLMIVILEKTQLNTLQTIFIIENQTMKCLRF